MSRNDIPTSVPTNSTTWLRSEICLILAGIAVGFSALWNDGFISSWGMLCLVAAAGAVAWAASDIIRGRSVPAGWWRAGLWIALSGLIAVNVLVYPGARWSTREAEQASQAGTSHEKPKSPDEEQIEVRWASRLGVSRDEARRRINGKDFEELGYAWAGLGWSYSPATFLSSLGDVIFRESIVFDSTQIAGMAVVSLLVLLGLSSRRRMANVSFVAAIAVYAILGARWLQKIPDPPIDTFVSQQAACKALLSGHNPYGTLIPDIYGDRATSYPEWIVKDGKLQVGFFYPPYSLLLALPGYVLTGDHRYSQLGALLIAVLLVGFSTSDRKARFAALILLLNPRNFMYLELGFTDHFVLLGLATVLFAAIRQWKWTGILLGLLLATKPYLVFVVPLVALLEGNRSRLLLQAFLSALVVTLPIALWDIGAFMNGCVLVHLASPFRKDSLSLPALGVWVGIDWQFMSFMANFGYLVAGIAILLCLGLFRRGTHSFAIASGITYLAFFLTAKQSFGNYFIPLVGMFGGAGMLRPVGLPAWQDARIRKSGSTSTWWGGQLATRTYRHSWMVQIGRNHLPAFAALSVGLWSLMVANDFNDGFFCPPAILWLTVSVVATFLAVDLATCPAPRDLRPLTLREETGMEGKAQDGPPLTLRHPLKTAVGAVHTLMDFLRRHPFVAAIIPIAAAGHLYWRFLDGYPGSHWCSPLGSTARQLGFERGELLWEYDPAKLRDRITRVAGLEAQLRDSRFLWGFGLVGVLALLTTVGRRRIAALAFPAALVVYAATGFYWVHQHPNPPNTDAFVLQQDGCAALLRGEKPYSITIPLVFDSGVQPYAPELVKDGRALFGYTYPPVMLFLNLPAYFLTGDHRYAEMLALAITAALMGYIRPGRFPKIVALFYLFCPRSFMIVEVSWTDPIVGMLIALTVFCAVRFPRATPYVFGVLVAAKQYSLFYIPLAVLLVPSGKPRDILTFLIKGGVTCAVLSLPLALLDWPGFMHSAIRLQFLQDWYEWSLGYMAVLWWIGVPVPVLHAMKMLPFLLALVFSFYCIQKLPRTPGAFALAICVVYLVFVAFNKQAFLNYYCMVFAAGCCALACGDFVRFQPPVPSGPDSETLARETSASRARSSRPLLPLPATSTSAQT